MADLQRQLAEAREELTAKGSKVTESEETRPESPFFGFSKSDIPQPIVIKTEPVEDGESDEDVADLKRQLAEAREEKRAKDKIIEVTL